MPTTLLPSSPIPGLRTFEITCGDEPTLQRSVQTRTRSGVEMGKLTNTLRVMVKPLASGTLEQYLSLVERDRPELQNAP